MVPLMMSMVFAYTPPPPVVERFAAAMTVSSVAPTAVAPLYLAIAANPNSPPRFQLAADQASSAILLGGGAAFV